MVFEVLVRGFRSVGEMLVVCLVGTESPQLYIPPEICTTACKSGEGNNAKL